MASGEIDNLLLRQRAIASIPSKFETVLYEGGKEKDAFWSRSHRFTYHDNELPGPGSYKVESRVERVAPSYSQKGYTGMASNSSRFFTPRRGRIPDPGSYNPDECFKKIVEKKDCNATNAMSMFHKPIVAPDYVKRRKNEAEVPGPGQYDPDQHRQRNLGKAVPFNTCAERFASKRRATAPGDGDDDDEAVRDVDYDAINRVSGAFAKVWHGKGQATSGFRSRTGRVFDEWHQPPPDPTLQSLKPHPSLGPSLGIQVDILPHSPKRDRRDEPGPGHYDPAADGGLSLERLRLSSMFARSTVDRFGAPLVPHAPHVPVPGPGAYHPPGPAPAPGGAAAAFVSASVRTVQLEPAAAGPSRLAVPGPAYYNPALPGKKSFNLNGARRWV